MKKLPIILVFGFALSAFGCDDGDNCDKKSAEEEYVETVLACAAGNAQISEGRINEFKHNVEKDHFKKLYPLCADSADEYTRCLTGTGCEVLLEKVFDLNKLGDEEWEALKKKHGADKCNSFDVELCVMDKYYKEEYEYTKYYKSCVNEYKKTHPDVKSVEDILGDLAFKSMKCLDESHPFYKCLAQLPCDVLINYNTGNGSDLGECKVAAEKWSECLAKNKE